jgi:hypothetical protein
MFPNVPIVCLLYKLILPHFFCSQEIDYLYSLHAWQKRIINIKYPPYKSTFSFREGAYIIPNFSEQIKNLNGYFSFLNILKKSISICFYDITNLLLFMSSGLQVDTDIMCFKIIILYGFLKNPQVKSLTGQYLGMATPEPNLC